jgi:hypothetical protein
VSISVPADQDLLVRLERSMRARFVVEPVRASVSFLGVGPIEILRFDTSSDTTSFISLGMSRSPMTGASESLTRADGPRAELLVEVRGRPEGLWRQLAVLAAAPVVEGVVYRSGMTVDVGSPLAEGSRCTGALVVTSMPPAVISEAVEVDIMSLLPATSTELAWCRVHGAGALQKRWAAQQIELRDLDRRSARLD